MVADPNGVLAQLIHDFLCIEAQAPIISLRIFIVAETLAVVDARQLSTQETEVPRGVYIALLPIRRHALCPSVVGNLEHARRTRSFIQIVVPPGEGGVDQPRGRNRTVVTQHPISCSVSDLAESGVVGAGQEQAVVWSTVRRVAGFARRITENRGLDHVLVIQFVSQFGSIVVTDLRNRGVGQNRESAQAVQGRKLVVDPIP